MFNSNTVDSRYNAIEGTEEFSRYIKSFTGLALYRETTVLLITHQDVNLQITNFPQNHQFSTQMKTDVCAQMISSSEFIVTFNQLSNYVKTYYRLKIVWKVNKTSY